MMKNLKQLLLAVAFIIGISISASAQEKGEKKPPKKDPPPVIVVKPQPKETPKGEKKPQAAIFNSRFETNFV